MTKFEEYTKNAAEPLVKEKINCLQINMGYVCNLACTHCHLEAGPHRQEMMSLRVVDDCLRFAKEAKVKEVDITGGAPEMNPNLRHLILGLRKIGSVERIILRSNLSILLEPAYADLPEFLAANKVEIVASMPCYLAENVAYQRGEGVYDKNIKVLQKLNGLGYGKDITLNLVYNPGDDYLPGQQSQLEADYKKSLSDNFGIVFNGLFTIANMPGGRFKTRLEKEGRLESYLKLLVDNYNADNMAKVMCRSLINVDWQGKIYDCDFNQALGMPLGDNYIGSVTLDNLTGKAVKLGDHCFTCVAGAGSSCQGTLDSNTVCCSA